MSTILVLDDDVGVLRMIEHTLRSDGHDVLTATTGQQAWRAASDHRKEIDLVITNLTLRDVRGVDAIQKIAELQPDAHILQISGRTPEMLLEEGRYVASFDFISKPFTPGVLLEKVREVLGERQNESLPS
ncbi:MAG: response regulator [Bryobacteraceae bacterium]